MILTFTLVHPGLGWRRRQTGARWVGGGPRVSGSDGPAGTERLRCQYLLHIVHMLYHIYYICVVRYLLQQQVTVLSVPLGFQGDAGKIGEAGSSGSPGQRASFFHIDILNSIHAS